VLVRKFASQPLFLDVPDKVQMLWASKLAGLLAL